MASAATKVAFVADQGVSSNAQSVLSLIKEEGADIVLIQGDLGYNNNTAVKWERNLTKFLGKNFPVLSLAGNHEWREWSLYERFIKNRVKRADGITCRGRVGVKASCTFGNLQVVQVAQGIYTIGGIKSDDNYDGFIRSSFKDSNYPWKVCAWHKNQHTMQAYSKIDETGWDIYDACLDSGAMIAMGHAHTYSRTYLMKNYRNQRVAHRRNNMLLEPGRSFAVVSGLGGHDIKPQENNGDWFASVYTQSQGATHGALFCTLENTTADCYFKAIDGSMPDRFTLRTRAANDETPEVASDVESREGTSSGVFRRTDKNEYRWIALDDSGRWSSRKISESCAMSLGGEQYSGNWRDVIALAPGVDTGASPCESAAQISPPPPRSPDATSNSGFVFSRTDKSEYRWVDRDEFGSIGNIWIDRECVDSLGGATAFGDWRDLNAIAPGFDTLASPCY